MPKKTRLDENAEIYQPRKVQTEKEKLREMTFKEKVSYLWYYYKYHAFATIAIGAFLIYVIIEIITPNIDTKLYAAMINNTIDRNVLDDLQIKFAEHLQLDPKREDVYFNVNFNYKISKNYTSNMKQVLTTYIAAKDVDIIIAPQSEIYDYAYYGYLAPLSDLLPTDLYSDLANNFYVTVKKDDTEERVYGIILSDTEFYKDYATFAYDDPYIIGIVSNARHKENAIEFIRYLFQNGNN